MELTRRQEIMVMLRERQWTLDELARNFVVSKKVIINDLEHIARSVARPSLRSFDKPQDRLRSGQARLQIHPPTCESCGFRFKDRSKFNDPSRCPRCKNEHLRSQRFQIA
jgi:predicted Zn-ribbon and HTH transcriptional regulator